jgi:hypothetical protein
MIWKKRGRCARDPATDNGADIASPALVISPPPFMLVGSRKVMSGMGQNGRQAELQFAPRKEALLARESGLPAAAR